MRYGFQTASVRIEPTDGEGVGREQRRNMLEQASENASDVEGGRDAAVKFIERFLLLALFLNLFCRCHAFRLASFQGICEVIKRTRHLA